MRAPETPRRFLVNAKNYFITYPQCYISKEDCLEQLKVLPIPSAIKYIAICRELHEYGKPHLHVLMQMEKKFKCQNPRFFDINHPNTSEVCHPNIQSAKSKTWNIYQKSELRSQHNIRKSTDVQHKDEALQFIRDEQPRDFLLQHHNINFNLDRVYELPTAPWVCPFPLSSFTNVLEDLQEWADSYFGIQAAARSLRPKLVIIEDNSRIGKTMWARSLGRHNHICGHMDLNKKVFSNNAEYNIIDDIPPQYFKHRKEFIGAQRNWQSNCKYGKPSLVKGGIPTIILCNPGLGFSYWDHLNKPDMLGLKEWTLNNVVFIFLNEPLYNTNNESATPF
ncbi:putative geminivirus AL1, replication-associated protein [Helianthus annuus]|nr:putative geminivirus AL1, replication-associated protein [Helianthus annuus]